MGDFCKLPLFDPTTTYLYLFQSSNSLQFYVAQMFLDPRKVEKYLRNQLLLPPPRKDTGRCIFACDAGPQRCYADALNDYIWWITTLNGQKLGETLKIQDTPTNFLNFDNTAVRLAAGLEVVSSLPRSIKASCWIPISTQTIVAHVRKPLAGQGIIYLHSSLA